MSVSGFIAEKFGALSLKHQVIVISAASLSVIGAGVYCANAINWSEGGRTGIVDKLSHKGLLCWTWEGELAKSGIAKSGALRKSAADQIDSTFYFSVRDPAVIADLQKAKTNRAFVDLEYQQKLFTLSMPFPGLCDRRTEYVVTKVNFVPDAADTAPQLGIRPRQP